MADVEVDGLPAASALTGADLLHVKQGGIDKQAALTVLIALLGDLAPSLLNTIDELAAAIGDDPNFAATMTTALAAKAADAAVVHNTGAETVAGVKTFSSSPIVPDPTTAQQAASRAFVLANAGTTPDADATTKGKLQLAGDLAGSAAAPTVPNALKLTGAQTVAAGNPKTFDKLTLLPTAAGPSRILEFRGGTGGSTTPPYDLSAYFSEQGDFATATSILVSNKRTGATGQIQGVSAVAAGAEPSMVAISPDINGPALALEAYGNMAAIDGQLNGSAIALYDLNDVHSGAGAYTPGYGKKKWAISSKGKMFWGSDLSNSPAANAFATLDASTGDFVFGADIRRTTVGGTVGAYYHQSHNNAGSYLQLDGTTASIQGRTAGAPVFQVNQQAAASNDILRINAADTTTILSRFGKGGRFGTRVNTSPADADVATSEAMFWYDNTGGAAKLMVKAKDAGGLVRTGSLVLT